MQVEPVNTPAKQLSREILKRVDSEQAIFPITAKHELSARLKDNVKIISMINNSRFERSRSRRKQQLFQQSYEHHSQQKNKRFILDEIINKLDSALKQSRTSLQVSRRCNSQSKDMEERIKTFQNILQQVKVNNQDNKQKLSQIKIKGQTSTYSITHYNNVSHSRKLLRYQGARHNRKVSHTNIKAGYASKGQYIYPKYIKPNTSRANSNICIQIGCRKKCRCGER